MGILLAASTDPLPLQHGPVSLPDELLTPGDVDTTDPKVICAWNYSPEHRNKNQDKKFKIMSMLQYGLDVRTENQYEGDHLIPIEIGGKDSMPNYWPQPWPEAREKDALENYAHADICYYHGSVVWWQEGFRTDWRKLYKQIYNQEP
jgi:hypothetical protein